MTISSPIPAMKPRRRGKRDEARQVAELEVPTRKNTSPVATELAIDEQDERRQRTCEAGSWDISVAATTLKGK
jgi:hypothetical protein